MSENSNNMLLLYYMQVCTPERREVLCSSSCQFPSELCTYEPLCCEAAAPHCIWSSHGGIALPGSTVSCLCSPAYRPSLQLSHSVPGNIHVIISCQHSMSRILICVITTEIT